MKKLPSVFCAVLLAALLTALLAACGAQEAAAVWLARIQGSVSVWDAAQKPLEPQVDLGLYDGYRVATEAQSCGWLSLDRERLAKLDAQSEVGIARSGRLLQLNVNAGSLFFNIDAPLAADETLEICCSNMVVGIRGTCGWVSATPEGRLRVCLLEGVVTCAVTPKNGEAVVQTVRAGEQGELMPEGEIVVEPLYREDIPDFVLEELSEKPELKEALPERADADAGADAAGAEAPGDNRFGLDPAAPYAQTLAEMPTSDGISPGLLHAERLDFEGDGDPELMVITVEEPEDVPEDPANSGPYIAVTFYKGDFITENAIVAADYETLLPGESISLAAADGRLFIGTRKIGGSDGSYLTTYFGPAHPQDGWWRWGPLQSIVFIPEMNRYHIQDFDETGSIYSETELDAAAYTGMFDELRVLVSNG